jgi:DNA invertase Pin-like site-specific DNA recombinase
VKRAVLYLRVSTVRMGCDIVKVYKDHGISGAKGRDKRPALNALLQDAAKRQFDMVMAWSVDRLGRSLQDLLAFLSELHALRIDLFLYQQGPRHNDTSRAVQSALTPWMVQVVDMLPRPAVEPICSPFMNQIAVLPVLSRHRMSLKPSPL